ncbi:LPXTG cell wall anchor domain-containing protein, partial [Streptococcus danieliae]
VDPEDPTKGYIPPPITDPNDPAKDTPVPYEKDPDPVSEPAMPVQPVSLVTPAESEKVDQIIPGNLAGKELPNTGTDSLEGVAQLGVLSLFTGLGLARRKRRSED